MWNFLSRTYAHNMCQKDAVVSKLSQSCQKIHQRATNIVNFFIIHNNFIPEIILLEKGNIFLQGMDIIIVCKLQM